MNMLSLSTARLSFACLRLYDGRRKKQNMIRYPSSCFNCSLQQNTASKMKHTQQCIRVNVASIKWAWSNATAELPKFHLPKCSFYIFARIFALQFYQLYGTCGCLNKNQRQTCTVCPTCANWTKLGWIVSV